MSDRLTPDSKVLIRPARPEDAKVVAVLDAEAGLSGWTPESYLQTGFQSGADFKVAETEQKIVAFCLSAETAGELEVLRIAVAPAEQGRGIGKRLLHDSLEEARRRGCTRGFLEVREANAPAIGLYLGFGFRLVGRRRKYYSAPTEDALILELDLV